MSKCKVSKVKRQIVNWKKNFNMTYDRYGVILVYDKIKRQHN